MTDKKQGLVVTTEHKGVFFGYGVPTTESEIRLEKARMCNYWSSDMQGVMGLAEKGPSKTCKVGPAIPAITLRDVTSVMELTPEAVKGWEKAIWG
jgi:hypothetical protein